MSETPEKIKFPLWAKLLIIISALPVVSLPMIINQCSAARYEEIKMFLMIYPLYVLASAVMAWISYRQRREVSLILIVVMLLTHAAMWLLPSAV
ncbi:MAG: hypothetical protein J6B30_05500 [Muribaculaceae bacterium]|nr:hypothetical protein [Muribaculaceae bacterium]MBQ3605150.1 hypothetical protein [Muribaculaceae bacterium]MBR3831613.1 hypothetical protein [Muribaculaceae bacterium]